MSRTDSLPREINGVRLNQVHAADCDVHNGSARALFYASNAEYARHRVVPACRRCIAHIFIQIGMRKDNRNGDNASA